METGPKYLIVCHFPDSLAALSFLDSGYHGDEHLGRKAILFRTWALTNLPPSFSNLKMEATVFLRYLVICQPKQCGVITEDSSRPKMLSVKAYDDVCQSVVLIVLNDLECDPASLYPQTYDEVCLSVCCPNCDSASLYSQILISIQPHCTHKS
jgi:hypothetical protein